MSSCQDNIDKSNIWVVCWCRIWAYLNESPKHNIKHFPSLHWAASFNDLENEKIKLKIENASKILWFSLKIE